MFQVPYFYSLEDKTFDLSCTRDSFFRSIVVTLWSSKYSVSLSLCANVLRSHVNWILLLWGVGVNFKPLKRMLVWHLDSVVFDKLKSLGWLYLFSSVWFFLLLVGVGCVPSTFCVFFLSFTKFFCFFWKCFGHCFYRFSFVFTRP